MKPPSPQVNRAFTPGPGQVARKLEYLANERTFLAWIRARGRASAVSLSFLGAAMPVYLVHKAGGSSKITS
jgi:uncharacterized membrane protein YidH (DUF202 family)